MATETNPPYEAANGLRLATPQGPGGADGGRPAPPEGEARLRLYSIREMARDFQVTIRALRFYESRGLLRPRREGSVRRYDDRDRLHLKMILKGKQLGFTLAEINEV
ncbi:MAG: MerR family transcriptional regulator [Beijerinckiaceae bacterium]|nr:MerR family transcriptional regulator [Beijerinckiaceae bacterium]